MLTAAGYVGVAVLGAFAIATFQCVGALWDAARARAPSPSFFLFDAKTRGRRTRTSDIGGAPRRRGPRTARTSSSPRPLLF